MKFYNRNTEIAEFQRIKEMAYSDHSKLTVITGRRRVGKTLLIEALKTKVLHKYEIDSTCWDIADM